MTVNTAIEQINNMDQIAIFGAGIMGKALKLCLESKPFNKKVSCFIVSSLNNNPAKIDDTTVIDIDSANEYKDKTIIVALNESNLPGAIETLNNHGFNKLLVLNAAGDEWSDVKASFFLYNQEQCFIPFKMLPEDSTEKSEGNKTTIYVVKSIYDKKIENVLPLQSYEKEIQVGSILTDIKICDIQDDKGDNISDRNRQYCELTALYWLWKNAKEDYLGICHYRRRFDVSSDQMENLKRIGADIVVTVPVINTAGVGYQYRATHSDNDWNVLREEVHNHSPEYDESFEKVEQQIYFHPYNMFVMRKDILNEFCEWMFPILFSCEGRIGTKEDRYQNRYPGFLSERLLNVFLYKNKDKYNIYVANKKYLG